VAGCWRTSKPNKNNLSKCPSIEQIKPHPSHPHPRLPLFLTLSPIFLLFQRFSFSGDLCELTLCANYKRRLMKISPSPVCWPLENRRTTTPSTTVEAVTLMCHQQQQQQHCCSNRNSNSNIATSEAIFAAIVLSLASGFLAWNLGIHGFGFVFGFQLPAGVLLASREICILSHFASESPADVVCLVCCLS